MQELLKELRRRVEQETRPSEQLYATMRQLGLQMFLTNTMGRETVLTFCAAMLKLYENLDAQRKGVS